jgi:5-formyltetrahydrofolate cyclo-ligase
MDEINRGNGIKQVKEACRREARRLMDAAGEDYRASASSAIALNLLGLPELKKARNVLAYCSVGSEPATLAIIDRLLGMRGKTVCLPLCTDLGDGGRRSGAAGIMEARVIKSFDDLVPGAYGIPEPAASTKLMAPDKIDLIIMPCVSCDRWCNRIGHGAGYYDYYLSMVSPKCFKAALCFEKVMLDEIPSGEHDVPVDAVVTEETVYRWRDRKVETDISISHGE